MKSSSSPFSPATRSAFSRAPAPEGLAHSGSSRIRTWWRKKGRPRPGRRSRAELMPWWTAPKGNRRRPTRAQAVVGRRAHRLLTVGSLAVEPTRSAFSQAQSPACSADLGRSKLRIRCRKKETVMTRDPHPCSGSGRSNRGREHLGPARRVSGTEPLIATRACPESTFRIRRPRRWRNSVVEGPRKTDGLGGPSGNRDTGGVGWDSGWLGAGFPASEASMPEKSGGIAGGWRGGRASEASVR